jgi:hypothetical protein
MTGSSGNGNPPRRHWVYSTGFYDACRHRIESLFPRVFQVRLFDQIEAYLRLLPPEDIAERLSGTTWMMTTPEGHNIPEIDVFFEYEDETITLQAAHPDL